MPLRLNTPPLAVGMKGDREHPSVARRAKGGMLRRHETSREKDTPPGAKRSAGRP